MAEILTAAQMRAAEDAAIASGAVTGLDLMERAGAGVVKKIEAAFPELGPGSGATVLCGPGNNGGDGFVIARLLLEKGWRVRVLAVPSKGRSADARAMRLAWRRSGGRCRVLTETALRRGDEAQAHADLFVDAVLGTGARGPIEGPANKALRHMAGIHGDGQFYRPRTVAVDLPSGLCADSGRVPGCPSPFPGPVPLAALTVTFHRAKPGHFLAHGPDLCGRLEVVDIGIERNRSQRAPFLCVVGWPEGDDELFPFGLHDTARRYGSKWSGHKFDHGHALVLGGGCGQGGAGRLAARGALRIGAGLVTLAVPPAALQENAARLDAVMLRKLRDGDDLAEALADPRVTALCMGPGLGTGAREEALLEAALTRARKVPKVLDADALTLLSRQRDLFSGLDSNDVLTPHFGEFARLFPALAGEISDPEPPRPQQEAGEITERVAVMRDYAAQLAAQRGPLPSRLDATRAAAAEAGSVVLLKGRDTVIGDPFGNVSIHVAAYGREAPWLATAGAGDVLAGFICGLLARGCIAPQAAALAAMWHVDCARAFGPGLIAEDLPEMLPRVLAAQG